MKADVCAVTESNQRELQTHNFQVNNINEAVRRNTVMIDNHKDELNRMDTRIEKIFADCSIVKQDNFELKTWKLDLKVYEEEVGLQKKELTYVKYAVEDVYRNGQSVENYIEKYLPFKIQNFVTETLGSCMGKREA